MAKTQYPKNTKLTRTDSLRSPSKTLDTSMKREGTQSDLTLPHHLVFQTSPIPIPTILIAVIDRQHIVGQKIKKLDVVYFVWIMWKKIKNIFVCRFSYLSKV